MILDSATHHLHVNFFAPQRCVKTTEEIDQMIASDLRLVPGLGDWRPLLGNHPYFEVWHFQNVQIDREDVSFAPKDWIDGAEELSATQEVVEAVTNLQSTSSFQFSGGGEYLGSIFYVSVIIPTLNAMLLPLQPCREPLNSRVTSREV